MAEGGVWTRVSGASRLVTALWLDDRGQDLVEYALLTAAVGFTGGATWPLIASAIADAYAALDAGTQNLWEPPPPGGGP